MYCKGKRFALPVKHFALLFFQDKKHFFIFNILAKKRPAT